MRSTKKLLLLSISLVIFLGSSLSTQAETVDLNNIPTGTPPCLGVSSEPPQKPRPEDPITVPFPGIDEPDPKDFKCECAAVNIPCRRDEKVCRGSVGKSSENGKSAVSCYGTRSGNSFSCHTKQYDDHSCSTVNMDESCSRRNETIQLSTSCLICFFWSWDPKRKKHFKTIGCDGTGRESFNLTCSSNGEKIEGHDGATVEGHCEQNGPDPKDPNACSGGCTRKVLDHSKDCKPPDSPPEVVDCVNPAVESVVDKDGYRITPQIINETPIIH